MTLGTDMHGQVDAVHVDGRVRVVVAEMNGKIAPLSVRGGKQKRSKRTY